MSICEILAPYHIKLCFEIKYLIYSILGTQRLYDYKQEHLKLLTEQMHCHSSDQQRDWCNHTCSCIPTNQEGV